MKDGDKVAVTLGFGDGSSKNVEAVDRKPGSAPAVKNHSAHEHKH
jgi:copper(I)-binding protein